MTIKRNLKNIILGTLALGVSGCATSQNNSRFDKLIGTYQTDNYDGQIGKLLFIDMNLDASVSITRKGNETEYFQLIHKFDPSDEQDHVKFVAALYVDSNNNGFDSNDTIYLAVEANSDDGVKSYVFLDHNADGTVDGIHLSNKLVYDYANSFDSLEFGGVVPEMDRLYQDVIIDLITQ